MITVLYEDQCSQPKNFGLHNLVLASLAADQPTVPPNNLRHKVVGIPKKGDNKLKRVLEQELARLCNRGPVVAVFDNDKIRRLMNLDKQACKREVLTALERCFQAGGNAAIVLLEQNAEDLLRASCQVLNRKYPDEKPTPPERDRILNQAAGKSSGDLDRIRKAMPSFDRLIRKIGDLLRNPPG